MCVCVREIILILQSSIVTFAKCCKKRREMEIACVIMSAIEHFSNAIKQILHPIQIKEKPHNITTLY